uniref:Bestrophin homolog n=1 Tax=Panagrellus redivivus TaxID=6233 RepID=A0A7E4WC07_PANRE
MTVTYSLDVASSTVFGLHRLLFRWKGSLWKSIWPELFLWCLLYGILSCIYRFVLTKPHQLVFEDLCTFFYSYQEYIPLTFMLGFYVNIVYGRWWDIFNNLGWVDSPALLIGQYVRGEDIVARNIRRNIIRYMILTQAMVFRDTNTSVKKRFPTMDHLVTAGLMTENELKEYDSIISPQLKYWVPMNWTFGLLRKSRELGLIESDIIYVDMLEKMRQYRIQILNLTLFDWVPVPLVYTQVVNLAVRSYFFVALFGRQYVINTERTLPNASVIDLYIPIMTILQFLFYMGWMKVAEVLLNPLGDDDDDFECNWVIDRNLQVGLSIVDDGYNRIPPLEKDIFWNDVMPEPLYTEEAASRPHNPMIGSCNDLTHDEAMILQPRRRRFMSVHTVDTLKDGDRPIGNEIPVKHHESPVRRASSVDANGKFVDSIKRKLSKAGSNRRIADFSDSYINAYQEWYDRNGVSPVPEHTGLAKLGNFSRNSSVNSSFLDGFQTPFAQSMPAHHFRPEPLNLNNLNERYDEYPSIEKNPSPVPPGMTTWTVNEMLPVIQEEDNDRKHTVASSRSLSSSASDVSKVKPPISIPQIIEESATGSPSSSTSDISTDFVKEADQTPVFDHRIDSNAVSEIQAAAEHIQNEEEKEKDA